MFVDPHYRILVGRAFDAFKKDYPVDEPQMAASAPESVVAGFVQYRWRKVKNGWPLVQLGPGLFTYNEGDSYKWATFRKGITDGYEKFLQIHPDTSQLKIANITIRYINAFPFNFEQKNVFSFLNKTMDIDINLPEQLHDEKVFGSNPNGFEFGFGYPLIKDGTSLKTSIKKGRKSGKPALIWDIVINKEIGGPLDIDSFNSWLDDANNVATECYKSLIGVEL